MTTKKCSKCGEEKLVELFSKDNGKKDKLNAYCKECDKKRTNKKGNAVENQATFRKNRPEKVKNNRLKHQYGITLVQYDEMYENQNCVCAICGGINKNGRRLSVDHDHTTGEVRALLCNSCNMAIGLLQDSPEVIIKAAQYLLQFKN